MKRLSKKAISTLGQQWIYFLMSTKSDLATSNRLMIDNMISVMFFGSVI